jgi:eukaryotic-like serine/threonine-protein kinase
MARLYEGDAELGHVFAVLQGQLNRHFEAINGRAKSTQHYWADDSRDLLALIRDISQVLHDLRRAGEDARLDERYQQALDRCETWLSPSGGSQVPEDFQQIDVLRYEAAFSREAGSVKLVKGRAAPPLKMVGEGSYAIVYSYVDLDYDKTLAVKRARTGVDERDLIRLKQEFDVMKRLSFPYVLEVYQFNEDRNEYRMEFCEETLRSYINKRNPEALSFSSRKRIALQLLYGINWNLTRLSGHLI